jgi:hypothetical protein
VCKEATAVLLGMYFNQIKQRCDSKVLTNKSFQSKYYTDIQSICQHIRSYNKTKAFECLYNIIGQLLQDKNLVSLVDEVNSLSQSDKPLGHDVEIEFVFVEENGIVKKVTQVADGNLPITVVILKDCLYRMYSIAEVDLYPQLSFVADDSKKIIIEEHKEPDEELGCHVCKKVIECNEESYAHCSNFKSHKKCFLQVLKNQTNGNILQSTWESFKKKRCPGCYKVLSNKEIISAGLLDHNTIIELMTTLKKRKADQHGRVLYDELMGNENKEVFLPCCLASSDLSSAIKHMKCIAEFSDDSCTLNSNHR